MVLLGPDDDLGFAPQRIVINGAPGAGKTTLAHSLSTQLALPHTEIDGLFHGPGWVPRVEFLDDVSALVADDRWITEYQYGSARPLLLARADLMIWLDPPRRICVLRVVNRTLRRRLRRQVLWNGNVEGPLWHFFTNDEHIVRWSWSSYPRVAERVEQALAERPDLPVVRLRTSAEVSRWRAHLPPPTCSGTPARPR
jgi:adenylate kinase family enzyme